MKRREMMYFFGSFFVIPVFFPLISDVDLAIGTMRDTFKSINHGMISREIPRCNLCKCLFAIRVDTNETI